MNILGRIYFLEGSHALLFNSKPSTKTKYVAITNLYRFSCLFFLIITFSDSHCGMQYKAMQTQHGASYLKSKKNMDFKKCWRKNLDTVLALQKTEPKCQPLIICAMGTVHVYAHLNRAISFDHTTRDRLPAVRWHRHIWHTGRSHAGHGLQGFWQLRVGREPSLMGDLCRHLIKLVVVDTASCFPLKYLHIKMIWLTTKLSETVWGDVDHLYDSW